MKLCLIKGRNGISLQYSHHQQYDALLYGEQADTLVAHKYERAQQTHNKEHTFIDGSHET